MNNYLEHHGILGMKWGLRRYQNPDGTLTAKGRERYRKVSSSERLQKRETKRAIRAAKYSAKDSEKNRKISQYKVNRLEAKLKNGKAPDYLTAKKIQEKRKKWAEKAEEFTKNRDYANQMLKDIDEGKKKAGRDFIVQRDYNTYPLVIPYPGGIIAFLGVNRTDTIVEKNRKHQTKADTVGHPFYI